MALHRGLNKGGGMKYFLWAVLIGLICFDAGSGWVPMQPDGNKADLSTIWMEEHPCMNDNKVDCVEIPKGFHIHYWEFQGGKLVESDARKEAYQQELQKRGEEAVKKFEAQLEVEKAKLAKLSSCISDVTSDAKMTPAKVKNCFKAILDVE